MLRNLELDLNLSVDPSLPPGEEHEEFKTIYNALRQLQDGLADAVGLVSLSKENRANSGMFELYSLGRHTFTVFEAGTNIITGQPCQVYNVSGEAKVRQPAQFYEQHTFEGGRAAAKAAGFMPLFNAAAGEKVACAGFGTEIPFPGAVPGYRYGLNSSFVLQAYAGKIAPYYTNNLLLDFYWYMQIGICINNNKLFVCPTHWAGNR